MPPSVERTNTMTIRDTNSNRINADELKNWLADVPDDWTIKIEGRHATDQRDSNSFTLTASSPTTNTH